MRRFIGKGGADEVHWETWDGFGPNSVYVEMRNITWKGARAATAAGGGSVGNPCLSRGAPDAHNMKGIIGTGDFRTCLSLAKRILTRGVKERVPRPYYPFVQETSDRFIGIANLHYTYEFFAGNQGRGILFRNLTTKDCSRRLWSGTVRDSLMER
jgi:Golgi apyrase